MVLELRSSRRAFCGGSPHAGIACRSCASPAQAAYPSRNFRVIIPTGQGGGAEKLARAFDAAWSKLLGQPFEYEFHAGRGRPGRLYALRAEARRATATTCCSATWVRK